jgi:hypothetical protein
MGHSAHLPTASAHPALGRFSFDALAAASIFADKLFGPAALFASETDEVWLGLPDFVPGQSHDRAAAKARGIFAGVQRVKQVFLLAWHSHTERLGEIVVGTEF